MSDPTAKSRCATCVHGKYPATKDGDQWVHLYEDGSFIGPCFDPPKGDPAAKEPAPGTWRDNGGYDHCSNCGTCLHCCPHHKPKECGK